MCEDFLRSLREEFAFLIRCRLVQGCGNGSGLGTAAQLFGWPPIGAARIKRIQNDVAAAGVIESLHELASWVEHNGRMAALLDLGEGVHQHRSFQKSPLLHLFEPLNFFTDGERELEKKRGKP